MGLGSRFGVGVWGFGFGGLGSGKLSSSRQIVMYPGVCATMHFPV